MKLIQGICPKPAVSKWNWLKSLMNFKPQTIYLPQWNTLFYLIPIRQRVVVIIVNSKAWNISNISLISLIYRTLNGLSPWLSQCRLFFLSNGWTICHVSCLDIIDWIRFNLDSLQSESSFTTCLHTMHHLYQWYNFNYPFVYVSSIFHRCVHYSKPLNDNIQITFVIEEFARSGKRYRRNVDKLLLREHVKNIIVNNALAIIIYGAETCKWHAKMGANSRKGREEISGFICLWYVIIIWEKWRKEHQLNEKCVIIINEKCLDVNVVYKCLMHRFEQINGNSWTAITVKCHFKYADYEMLHTLFINKYFVCETSRKTETIHKRFEH